MTTQIPTIVLEFEQWLSASMAEAEVLVPDLLALPGPRMVRELRLRPELRTAGVMKRLLAVAHASLHRLPSRAYEIAMVVGRYARSMQIPSEFDFVSRLIQGEAWKEQASALGEIGRPEKAEAAIRLARRFLADAPGKHWHLATVDLVEAPLLHDRGLVEEALRMVRHAAQRFDRSRDHANYLEARTIECWMLWFAGDRVAAGAVWTATENAARNHGDEALVARTAAKMGIFELRHGTLEEGIRLLMKALELFAGADYPEEIVRVHWNLASAAARQGRTHTAISEYHMVRTKLLDLGLLNDAAIAAAESLEVHLLGGREDKLPWLTTTFVHLFRDAGLPINAMEPLTYLRGRANAETLTHADVVLVRTFFEDLPQKPNTRFHAP